MNDFQIGLVSGVASSFLVTVGWYALTFIVEYRRKFDEDIQTLCRYLDHIRLELDLSETTDKSANIRRLIDLRPRTSSFDHGMNKEVKVILSKLVGCLNELDNVADHGTLSKVECLTYKSKLLRHELDLLKKQNEINSHRLHIRILDWFKKRYHNREKPSK